METTTPTAALLHDQTPWQMFMHADVVVQAVMAMLALASLATWTVLLAKSWEYARQRRQLAAAHTVLMHSADMGEACASPQLGTGLPGALVAAADEELRLSHGLAGVGGTRERVASRLERIELAHARQLRQGTGVLATIGATAPFVGLFGTVWGIMSSFIGIAQSNTTNLAVVAPGIAEALLATALGLVAAIPAVVIYNHFSRTLAALKGTVGDLSTGVQLIVSRELDRAASAASQRATRVPSPAAALGA